MTIDKTQPPKGFHARRRLLGWSSKFNDPEPKSTQDLETEPMAIAAGWNTLLDLVDRNADDVRIHLGYLPSSDWYRMERLVVDLGIHSYDNDENIGFQFGGDQDKVLSHPSNGGWPWKFVGSDEWTVIYTIKELVAASKAKHPDSEVDHEEK